MEIIICTVCKGSGFVTVFDPKSIHRNELIDQPCIYCSGSGRLYVWQPAAITQPMTVDGLKKLADLSNKMVNIVKNG